MGKIMSNAQKIAMHGKVIHIVKNTRLNSIHGATSMDNMVLFSMIKKYAFRPDKYVETAEIIGRRGYTFKMTEPLPLDEHGRPIRTENTL